MNSDPFFLELKIQSSLWALENPFSPQLPLFFPFSFSVLIPALFKDFGLNVCDYDGDVEATITESPTKNYSNLFFPPFIFHCSHTSRKDIVLMAES